MPFTLKIVAAAIGEFDFTEFEVPLFNRRIAWNRINEQGPAMRRIECGINGYFRGNKNDKVMAKLETLLDILKSNRVTLHYNDGVRDVVNQQAWVADYNDPSEWKQYVGNYGISLYYFDDAVEQPGETIQVSYVTDAGTYDFSPSPTISHAIRLNRNSHRQSRTTPSGVYLNDTIQLTLEGFIRRNNATELETERQRLIDAFSRDGTLNYGTFIQGVRVGQRNIPPCFPLDHLNYSIELLYDFGSDIAEFEATREFSRLHANPIIRERPYCGSPNVTLLATSGQTVSYSFKIASMNREQARTLLANEATLLVFPGGTELPGGREIWSENDASVTVNFTKFHADWVLANLPGT